MGMLIDGEWHDRWYDTDKTGGRFVRQAARFRSWIRADGSTRFPAARSRYHLYASYACPWASRTLIFRKLKRLEDVIGLSVVHPLMLGDGWRFGDDYPGCAQDTVYGLSFLRELYVRAQHDYTGRVTVPVLWDRETGTIVSNESAEIIRMLNSELDDYGDSSVDLCPDELLAEINQVNELVYDRVNNGVYKAGFATSQAAYEDAVRALFVALDELEARLERTRYLVGDRITEADVRLFTTLVRFDPVYHGHFKCNLRPLRSYPNLWGYTRELYQLPGVAETVHFDHIKDHYYGSHPTINPSGVVPVGPAIDWSEPHGRDDLPGRPLTDRAD